MIFFIFIYVNDLMNLVILGDFQWIRTVTFPLTKLKLANKQQVEYLAFHKQKEMRFMKWSSSWNKALTHLYVEFRIFGCSD